MKTSNQLIKLLRAIKAASPYASRNFQWEVGMNLGQPDPFKWNDRIGGYDDVVSWRYGIADDVQVGSRVDFYVYRNEGDVRNPDWNLWTNYIVTITSPTTATIEDTCHPLHTFSL